MAEDKKVRIYDPHDRSQYEDERAYWRAQPPSFKLAVLEELRSSAHKLGNNGAPDGDVPRLRRVFRISNLK
ncbi:MAG: hypothetical protein BMS9Abin05_1673 [Rhodothermia bacterium]|nr:MAG: hypothetical protein BMS9Abin05_1673 [Rhodothermia bacterium]